MQAQRTQMRARPARGTAAAPGWWQFYRSKEPLILGVVSVSVLAILWEISGQLNWVDPAFSSRPSAIIKQFYKMYLVTGDIYYHLGVSFQEVGIGFLLSLVVGVIAGLILGRLRRARYVVEPYIMAFYSTPTVAFFPLLILWFGIGIVPKVVLVFLGGVFAILVNTQAGVENTDPRLVETAVAFRASEWQIFYKIMLPSAIPYILAGTRLAIGRSLIMMFVGEMFVANKGVGYIVSEAGATFQTDRLFVGVLTLTIAGVALAQFLRYIEQRKFGYLQHD